MTPQPALTPPTKPTEPFDKLRTAPTRPITIFIYDSAPLARAIRRSYIDNPAIYWVESKWLPDGTQRVDVWKRGAV